MNNALVNINGDGIQSLELLFYLTMITLLPAILIMMTSFTRIIIVFSFLRSAMGLQQTPPNNVLIGIAIFLTLFIMSPVIAKINTDAYQPYAAQEINQNEALNRASVPLKDFMLKQTEIKPLNMFLSFANMTAPDSLQDLPLTIIVPAFVTSELNRAFVMGFLLYIPFLLIDIIVASTLMSMGMIMLPPGMISMPFKLLLFIVVGGWEIVFSTLIKSFAA